MFNVFKERKEGIKYFLNKVQKIGRFEKEPKITFRNKKIIV